jgi:hypothetical protein
VNDREAIRKVDELRSKGWEFQIQADADGWECRAIGPGLSHADSRGFMFEWVVEHAIKEARAMEDDPASFIAQCGPGIRSALVEAFGPDVKYRIEVQDEKWDWGPKRIMIVIAPGHCDVKKHLDQEMPFSLYLSDLERKTRVHLHVGHEWPDEQEAPESKT